MNILKHPGNLGPSRGSLLTVHHGDWPAYPEGNDHFEALFQFTAFPAGTSFIAVDDMDRALLFIADVKCGTPSEPRNPKNFHLAAWHEDLAELQRRGFIEGIKPVTERQWFKNRWDKLRSLAPEGLFRKGQNGELTPIEEPKLDDYDDDEEWKPLVATPTDRIQVTTAGRAFVHSSLSGKPIDIAACISEKVQHLFVMKYFDTCIREACVQLECEIKTAVGSEMWGDKLTETFIQHLRGKNDFLESVVRTFRQELRSVFKMIRNDFMHNLSEADETTALVILTRISRVRSMLRDEPKG